MSHDSLKGIARKYDVFSSMEEYIGGVSESLALTPVRVGRRKPVRIGVRRSLRRRRYTRSDSTIRWWFSS